VASLVEGQRAAVGTPAVLLRAAEGGHRRVVVLAGEQVARGGSAIGVHDEQVRAQPVFPGAPVAVQQPIDDARAAGPALVLGGAPLVAGVVAALGVYLGDERQHAAVGRPLRAIGARRNARDLPLPAARDVVYPDLRRAAARADERDGTAVGTPRRAAAAERIRGDAPRGRDAFGGLDPHIGAPAIRGDIGGRHGVRDLASVG